MSKVKISVEDIFDDEKAQAVLGLIKQNMLDPSTAANHVRGLKTNTTFKFQDKDTREHVIIETKYTPTLAPIISTIRDARFDQGELFPSVRSEPQQDIPKTG